MFYTNLIWCDEALMDFFCFWFVFPHINVGQTLCVPLLQWVICRSLPTDVCGEEVCQPAAESDLRAHGRKLCTPCQRLPRQGEPVQWASTSDFQVSRTFRRNKLLMRVGSPLDTCPSSLFKHAGASGFVEIVGYWERKGSLGSAPQL